MTKPLKLRELKAQMAMKEITLADLAEKAGVSYWYASRILNGRAIDKSRLEKLRTAIETTLMPAETH